MSEKYFMDFFFNFLLFLAKPYGSSRSMETKSGTILEVVSKTKFHTPHWLKMLIHNLKCEFSCGVIAALPLQ